MNNYIQYMDFQTVVNTVALSAISHIHGLPNKIRGNSSNNVNNNIINKSRITTEF